MRYYLHIRTTNGLVEDPEGAEFASLPAAYDEAIQAARDLMANDLRAGRPLGENRSIEICDENGTLVAAMPFQDALHRSSDIAPTTASTPDPEKRSALDTRLTRS